MLHALPSTCYEVRHYAVLNKMLGENYRIRGFRTQRKRRQMYENGDRMMMKRDTIRVSEETNDPAL
jgi:hypothetical protein